MNYSGVIIEESLRDTSVLAELQTINTRISVVTPEHKTPWLAQWTMHTVEVAKADAANIANKLSKALETEHTSWYIDFKNNTTHYIIFPGKVFVIDRTQPTQYKPAVAYGIQLGIPDHQLDFV